MASTNISEPVSHGSSASANPQTRIAKLLTELAAIRPARRRGDQTRRQSLEAELVVLLDAETLSRKKAREAAASPSAKTD